MAPIIDPDFISVLIFLLGIFAATLILIYSALSHDDSEEESEGS